MENIAIYELKSAKELHAIKKLKAVNSCDSLINREKGSMLMFKFNEMKSEITFFSFSGLQCAKYNFPVKPNGFVCKGVCEPPPSRMKIAFLKRQRFEK